MLARIRTFSAVTAVHLANTLPRAITSEGESAGPLVDLGYLRALGLEDRLDEWKQVIAGQMERCGVAAE